MKQFDDMFSKRVREVFSNYNADHLADKGWQLFIARRRKKFAGLFVLPFWAKAASVVFILTAGTLLTYKILNKQKEANVTAIHKITADTILNKIAETGTERFKATEINRQAKAVKGERDKIIVSNYLKSTGKTESIKAGVISKPSEYVDNETLKNIEYQAIAMQTDTGKMLRPELVKQEEDKELLNAQVIEAIKNYPEADTMKTKDIVEKEHKKKSSLIAGVSGMMAVIDNALVTTPGVSAGFYYEYQFTRRIAIRPGFAIAMHSSPVENRTGRTDLNYAAPLYDGTTGTTDYYEARLRLVSLELPVNMVFKVIAKEKSSLFFSAGASTLICLNQKFTGTFVNSYTKAVTNSVTGEMMTSTNYSTVEVEKTEGAFSHADYFGLANFSAGYSVPFGKGSLLIEPYIQMPLSDITSLGIKIYYSGVSLKLKFGK